VIDLPPHAMPDRSPRRLANLSVLDRRGALDLLPYVPVRPARGNRDLAERENIGDDPLRHPSRAPERRALASASYMRIDPQAGDRVGGINYSPHSCNARRPRPRRMYPRCAALSTSWG